MTRRPLLSYFLPAPPRDHRITHSDGACLTTGLTSAEAYTLAGNLRHAGWTVSVERVP